MLFIFKIDYYNPKLFNKLIKQYNIKTLNKIFDYKIYDKIFHLYLSYKIRSNINKIDDIINYISTNKKIYGK